MNNKFTKPKIEFLNFICDEIREFDSYSTRKEDTAHTTSEDLIIFDRNDIPN